MYKFFGVFFCFRFQHTRRNIGRIKFIKKARIISFFYLATITDECVIESRSSDTFNIVFENYDVLVIVRIFNYI